jgi:hypothetical protein
MHLCITPKEIKDQSPNPNGIVKITHQQRTKEKLLSDPPIPREHFDPMHQHQSFVILIYSSPAAAKLLFHNEGTQWPFVMSSIA